MEGNRPGGGARHPFRRGMALFLAVWLVSGCASYSAVRPGAVQPGQQVRITLDPDAAPGFAQQNGIDDPSPERLADEPAVLEEVQRGIDRANEQLARVEQIKKFKLLPVEWEPGGEELTPTMKLKRKPIAEKYRDEIEALYA